MPTPPPTRGPADAAADADAAAGARADRLAERYGRTHSRPWWRRPVPLVAAVLAVGGLLAWMVWVVLASTAERAEPTVISYRVLDDSRIELRYTVAKEPSTTVRCVLQALDAAHGEVGVVEDEFGPGPAELVDRTTVVRTTGRAVTAVVRSCGVLTP
ncbi:hypothetical protein NUM3379_09440 [Kineococcus sp. NUM-3379]